MSGHKGERATGGGRSSYRHPVEEERFAEALRASKGRHAERFAAKVAANMARRERERREGLIP